MNEKFRGILFALLLASIPGFSQPNNRSASNQSSLKPIDEIRRIFDSYKKYEDGRDSDEDKDRMRQALQSLSDTMRRGDMLTLLDVYMYYMPTDFPACSLVYDVFKKNRAASCEAIEYRIKHKRKWESDQTLTDLRELKKRLEH